MSGAISTHVLDTSLGRAVAGLEVRLLLEQGDGVMRELSRRATDPDGRVRDLLGTQPLVAGVYALCFETNAYFNGSARPSFYERVEIQFRVSNPAEHHHVPLLLSPFGYSTYRGT